MEKTIPSINERWKLCTCASFIGCIALLIMLNQTILMTLQNLGISLISPNATGTNLQVLGSSDSNIEDQKHINISDDHQEKCNLFEGNWIYDPEGSPMYDGAKCPFLSEQVDCRRNGRPEFDYEKWTWEPKGCHIPRHNIGKDMLEKLRGKRMIIVGDSLNRNQFESMACLLYTSLTPSQAHVNVKSGSYKVLSSKEYKCSVEFYWSPFLVQLRENKTNGDKILILDKLSDSVKKWRGADIMVFNTGHWWLHQGKLKAWDYFQYKGKVMPKMETEVALKMAMKTWAHWIDKTANASKTRVFFRSLSPSHKGQQWCYNETKPSTDDSYPAPFPKKLIHIVERAVEKMKTPVIYLNITRLSHYRRDAHPSIYRTKQGKDLIASHQNRPQDLADCNHWCVPGLPDTWNRLLFASIPLEISKDTTPS